MMLSEDKFFQTHDRSKTWNRYCGFLDLSVSEFMDIQERLLLEQIGLVADSPLGKIIMRGQKPTSVEEFRRTVPLTTYKDYAPYIGERQEDCLARKPYYWVHTSHTKGAFKQVPWNEHFVKTQLRNVIATLILSSATHKGDIQLAPGCRILAILPERPFVSAQLAFGLLEQFSATSVLSLELCEKLPFRQKIDAALRQALSTDIDYIITMTSSFLPMGRGLDNMVENRRLLPMLPKAHHMVSLRLLKNQPRRLFQCSGKLLPRDLWSVKGIVAWGTDSDALRNITQEQWGKTPIQFYGSSESGLIAMQDWEKDKMTFLPDSVFLEFIPEEEINREEGASTVLIDELEEGKAYELVITNLYGMPLLRYRQGDLVRIVSRKAGENSLPRMIFYKRADDIIDLFGIARLNLETVRAASELAGIPHTNWGMRKECEQGKPVLRFYIELNSEMEAPDLERRLHRKLKEVDRHYLEATHMMAYNPVKVIPLPQGAFERYSHGNRKNGHSGNGHDPDLLKLPQMNLSDAVASALLQREKL